MLQSKSISDNFSSFSTDSFKTLRWMDAPGNCWQDSTRLWNFFDCLCMACFHFVSFLVWKTFPLDFVIGSVRVMDEIAQERSTRINLSKCVKFLCKVTNRINRSSFMRHHWFRIILLASLVTFLTRFSSNLRDAPLVTVKEQSSKEGRQRERKKHRYWRKRWSESWLEKEREREEKKKAKELIYR